MVRLRVMFPAAVVALGGVFALGGCSFDENVFAVTFVNDTTQTLSIGLCVDETCRSGDREYTAQIRSGKSVEANVNGDANIVNAFLVTDRAGDRAGCFLLHYQHKLTGRIVYRLSRAHPCTSS
jgi:hypothetical protein